MITCRRADEQGLIRIVIAAALRMKLRGPPRILVGKTLPPKKPGKKKKKPQGKKNKKKKKKIPSRLSPMRAAVLADR